MNDDYLLRSRLLLGDSFISRIKETKVILFGVGGVGSWCAEALVRNGIERLTIVDFDVVSPSNVNRQLLATRSTVGRVKVEVMKERLLDINPDAEITAINERYSEETAESFGLENYDVIIDAIDSLSNKSSLILRASGLKNDSLFFSSMGAALKIDPTKICVDEFWKVNGCPLAAAIRKRFKKNKIFPAKKFKCVFSPELRENHEELLPEGERANGSLVHITGIFGFTIAGLVMMELEKKLQNR